MKKAIIFSVIISIFLIFDFNYSKSETIYELSRTRKGEGANGFEKVTDVTDSWFDIQGNFHHKRTINCEGAGSKDCPAFSNASPPMVVDPNDECLDQDFLTNSIIIMEEYALEQIDLGNYSGYHSFNAYYNDCYVYRNVTWSGCDSDCSISIYIFPYVQP